MSVVSGLLRTAAVAPHIEVLPGAARLGIAEKDGDVIERVPALAHAAELGEIPFRKLHIDRGRFRVQPDLTRVPDHAVNGAALPAVIETMKQPPRSLGGLRIHLLLCADTKS